MNARPADVDAYLAELPEDARRALEQVRRAILEVAPDAVESISYGMPAYKYRGRPLVYFGAAKRHCAIYGTSVGTIRFPPSEPPSAEFLQALIQERIAEIESQLSGRSRKRTEP